MFRKELAQCNVHCFRITKHLGKIGREKDKVRSLSILPIVLASNALAEVVLSSHLIAGLLFICLLHKSDALA